MLFLSFLQSVIIAVDADVDMLIVHRNLGLSKNSKNSVVKKKTVLKTYFSHSIKNVFH